MDHDGYGGWPDDDYSGESAETADLGGGDESLPHDGLGGYDDGGAYHDGGGDPGGIAPDAGDAGDDPGGHPGGGDHYLEDDPMSFDAGDGGGDGGDGGEPHDVLASADQSDTGDTGDGDEPYDTGEPHGEAVVGADPDVDPDADWSPEEFPAHLDINQPEPVDGYPWSDPNAVADPGTAGADPAAGPDAAPPPADLLDYAGSEAGADPWAALVGSDDPATSSLGRWWAPG